ncbi:hypothetical protein ACLMJK_007885 [Lecanora helva]
MAEGMPLAFRPKKEAQNGIEVPDEKASNIAEGNGPNIKSIAEKMPQSPRDESKTSTLSPIESDSYFNSFRSSRAASVYSLSRLSLSSQLTQLTSLTLPDAPSLSTSISSIPNAPKAANVLGNAAGQIKAWLAKANDVLSGLDAEDDVEWAAAGGREGLGEVDAAIGKFEGLIGIYVKAIEDLQEREDISNVPADQQTAVVDQMEGILMDWENVRRSLKHVKLQVEIAMEWEELWNVVLGEIGLEMENLSTLVFEMEEARHKALLSDPVVDGHNASFDMQELDTIVEEGEKENISRRISLQPISLVAPNSPMSPNIGIAPDDTRLLALFARMQPLRASLDFLPMTLASFTTRAISILPTACQELESRRKTLEKKWKTLESDAEGLRKELGEDRWVVAFRNVGRQVSKLQESMERAINRLQESIDIGDQHSNPPLLARKIEGYEAKKSHYGPAIEKLLALIAKGVTDRTTVNGEILRLHADTKARWEKIKVDIKDMNLSLDDLSMNKNQQLRDSISSIMSIDRSGTSIGSAINTPGSSPASPASSIILGSMNGSKRDESPGLAVSSRRSSIGYNSSSRPPGARRNFTMPSACAASTQLPRKTPISRSFSSDRSSRGASPSPYAKQSSATPTPGSRPQRPSLQTDSRPRWNSSPKVDYFEFGSKPRPLPFSTPVSARRTPMTPRSSASGGSYSSGLPLPSPLGRSSPALAQANATINTRIRQTSGVQTSLGMRQTSFSSPAQSSDWVKVKEKTPPSTASVKRQSIGINDTPGTPGTPGSPSARPRPSTSLANGRRVSMLPVPKSSLPSATGTPTSHGRQTSLGYRSVSGL